MKRNRTSTPDHVSPNSRRPPNRYRPRSSPFRKAPLYTKIENLKADIYPHIFDALDAQTLANLSATCRNLRQAVWDHLGYRHVTVSDPTDGMEEEVSRIPELEGNAIPASDGHPATSLDEGGFVPPPTRAETNYCQPPPRISSQSSAIIRNKMFVPILDGDLVCYVFDVIERTWSKFRINLAHERLKDDQVASRSQVSVLAMSVASSQKENCLYLFGGLKVPSVSTWSISEDRTPRAHGLSATYNPSYESINLPGSTSIRPPAALNETFEQNTSSTSEEWILSTDDAGDSSGDFTSSSDFTSGDEGTGLRLSSGLYRLDIPQAIFDKTIDSSSIPWKLWFLGDRDHRSVPLPPAAVSSGGHPKSASQRKANHLYDLSSSSPQHDPGMRSTSTAPSVEITDLDSIDEIELPAPVLDSKMPHLEGGKTLRKLWPGPRSDNTLDVINGWLVVFGGMGSGSEGDNDVWAWDIVDGGWIPACSEVYDGPKWPRTVYRHASAVLGDCIYFYGGCMTDTPLIIFDNLFRLNCVGSPSKWWWTLYKSPALYHLPQASPGNETRSSSLSSGTDSRRSGNSIVKKTASVSQHGIGFHQISNDEHQLEPSTTTTTTSAIASQRSIAHPSSIESSPEETQSASLTVSSGSRFSSSIPSRESSFLRKNRTSDGVATSGDVPIERFGAALVALGERRLAVIGGLTVSEGIDKSGLVFDEFCATQVTAVDIFDIPRRHWTSLRGTQSGPHLKSDAHTDYSNHPSTSAASMSLSKSYVQTIHGEFLLETSVIPRPPDKESRLWSILIVGKILDLAGYEVEYPSIAKSCSDSGSGQLSTSLPGSRSGKGSFSSNKSTDRRPLSIVEELNENPQVINYRPSPSSTEPPPGEVPVKADAPATLVISQEPVPMEDRQEFGVTLDLSQRSIPDLEGDLSVNIDERISTPHRPSAVKSDSRPRTQSGIEAPSVRFYHRSGSICLASTFSHRPRTSRIATQIQPTSTSPPQSSPDKHFVEMAIRYPYPEGVFTLNYDGSRETVFAVKEVEEGQERMLDREEEQRNRAQGSGQGAFESESESDLESGPSTPLPTDLKLGREMRRVETSDAIRLLRFT